MIKGEKKTETRAKGNQARKPAADSRPVVMLESKTETRAKPGLEPGPEGSATENITVKKTRGKRGKDKQQRKKRTDKSLCVNEGDNANILKYTIALSKLKKIDVNNPSLVAQRIDEFFDICIAFDMKPAIASLALAFGIDRVTLFTWITGRVNTIKNIESLNTIKTAYTMINSQYEIYMNNGKINPIAAIFLMKNNMGYTDTSEYKLTTNNQDPLTIGNITDRAGLLND